MVRPSDRIRGGASDDLAGRRIVLGVTGSIAAVKCVELARELVRHGATVVPVMTPAALRIVTADALEFAAGVRPVTRLSGAVEHVSEFGEDGDADLLLVAPATANTIAKMALGVDDTALTTFASVALGAGRPVLVAPAMHGPMEENVATRRHVEDLKERGVVFVRPLHEEGKAKLAPVDEIVAEVRRALGPGTLRGKRVLVVSGPSSEPIDTVRVVTNRSSGAMGLAVAREAHRLGADVIVLTSQPELAWPPGTEVTAFSSVKGLGELLEAQVPDLRPDWVLVPAALADYAPEVRPHKLTSAAGDVDVRLAAVPKVLPLLRRLAPDARIVGWKLQDTLDEAVDAARERLSDYRIDAFVANGAATLAGDAVAATIVLPQRTVPMAPGDKGAVARRLLRELAALFEQDRT